jgi:putative Holliday junction resolvase
MPSDNISVRGCDYGTKKIGTAIGQSITQSASPLPIVKVKKSVPDWHNIDALIQKWQPDVLIVGIPLNMDDTEQPITEKARAFTESLQERYQLPTHGIDERLTTKEARQQIFDQGGYQKLQQTDIDGVAAALMIEDWLATNSVNNLAK